MHICSDNSLSGRINWLFKGTALCRILKTSILAHQKSTKIKLFSLFFNFTGDKPSEILVDDGKDVKDVNENAEGVTMTIEGMKNYTKTVMKYTTCAFQRVMDQEFGEHLDDTAYAVFTEFLDKKK